jgi:hypothetical protein
LALSKLITEEFGVKTRVNENPVTNSVGTSFVEILRNNPDRLAFIVVNLSANEVYLGLERDVSASKGIRLNANGGILSMTFKEDLATVGRAIFALASGAGSTIYVQEVEAE